MIYRKPRHSDDGTTSPLARICARIQHDNALRLSVMDAHDDDGDLVIFCNEEAMVKIIKLSLQKHWPGNIAVFCPASLVTGANASAYTDDESIHYMDRSLQKQY